MAPNLLKRNRSHYHPIYFLSATSSTRSRSGNALRLVGAVAMAMLASRAIAEEGRRFSRAGSSAVAFVPSARAREPFPLRGCSALIRICLRCGGPTAGKLRQPRTSRSLPAPNPDSGRRCDRDLGASRREGRWGWTVPGALFRDWTITRSRRFSSTSSIPEGNKRRGSHVDKGDTDKVWNAQRALEKERLLGQRLKGASLSTSDFITHYIAGGSVDKTTEKGSECKMEGVTVKEAIASVLPVSRGTRQEDMEGPIGSLPLFTHTSNNDLMSKVAPSMRHDPSLLPPPNEQLTAMQLLALGAIWFLPASAPRDPAMGGKPVRLAASDACRILDEGGYLRVHHSPRRFPAVSQYDWGRTAATSDPPTDERSASNGAETQLQENNEMETQRPETSKPLPGVIVAENADIGYMVINKPAGLPVHASVDNILENVSAAIGRALLKKRWAQIVARENEEAEQAQIERCSMNRTAYRNYKKQHQKLKHEPLVYVSTQQRLDQNTSGLFLVSTSKSFAGYFGKLLRYKTDNQLRGDNEEEKVHKKYRCLVCICPTGSGSDSSPRSMTQEVNRLRTYASSKSLIRHFLEPSIRAPKKFSRVAGNSTWAESLLRITKVGEAYPIVGSDAAEQLSRLLWVDARRIPAACVAVVEVEVELLTGRTHQIRGQMSSEGYPLVGDVQYGGSNALPADVTSEKITSSTNYMDSERLALQCCELEFVDPDVAVQEDTGQSVFVPSNRWNKFRLGVAWWTPLVDQYKNISMVSSGTATTSETDQLLVERLKQESLTAQSGDDSIQNVTGSHFPPQVVLSPGVHKYVLVKAVRPPSESPIWFVRSASPSECGGPYHANVAEDVVRQLSHLGYETTVMGGGRIDFNEFAPHAHVFGFSYGFGKGDHALAASVIEEWSEGDIIATHDDSEGLY